MNITMNFRKFRLRSYFCVFIVLSFKNWGIVDGICISASKSNLPHPHDGMLNVWLNLVVYMQLALCNRLKVFTESKIWIVYSSLQAIYFLNFVKTEMHYVSIVHIRSRPTIVSYIVIILSFRALRVAIVLGHVVLNLS